jgi:hypothetical protein
MNSKVLFRISVVVGNKTENLLVHADDSPEILCREFTEKHHLPESSYQELLAGIHSCIDELANSYQVPQKKQEISRSCEATSLFSRLSTPKNVKLCKSPQMKQLETADTKTRLHLLCSFKEKQEVFSFKPELNAK